MKNCRLILIFVLSLFINSSFSFSQEKAKVESKNTLNIPLVFDSVPGDNAFGVTNGVVFAEGRNRATDKHVYGFVLLDEDYSSWRAMRQAIPSGKISAVGIRMESNDGDGLRKVAEDMPYAGKMLADNASAETIQYGCNSGSIALGVDNVNGLIGKEAESVETTTSVTRATIEAITVLTKDVKNRKPKLVIISPYGEEFIGETGKYFEDQGYNVIGNYGMNISDDYDRGRVSIETTKKWMAKAYEKNPDADVVFTACTNMRTLPFLAELETIYAMNGKKPAFTSSHQAMAWYAMRLAGDNGPLATGGRLSQLSISKQSFLKAKNPYFKFKKKIKIGLSCNVLLKNIF